MNLKNLMKSSREVTNYATKHAEEYGVRSKKYDETLTEYRAYVALELICQEKYTQAHEVLFQKPAGKYSNYNSLANYAKNPDYIANQASKGEEVYLYQKQIAKDVDPDRIPPTTQAHLGHFVLAAAILALLILIGLFIYRLKLGGIL